jgi:integrase/recombinase XerD
MLEHYYVKPSTIDRIRDSWLGSQIENYVGWMEANGYTSRTVFRRLPRLFGFAEFAQKRGCTDVASAFALVEDFVSEWLVQHGPEAKTSAFWESCRESKRPLKPARSCRDEGFGCGARCLGLARAISSARSRSVAATSI